LVATTQPGKTYPLGRPADVRIRPRVGKRHLARLAAACGDDPDVGDRFVPGDVAARHREATASRPAICVGRPRARVSACPRRETDVPPRRSRRTDL